MAEHRQQLAAHQADVAAARTSAEAAQAEICSLQAQLGNAHSEHAHAAAAHRQELAACQASQAAEDDLLARAHAETAQLQAKLETATAEHEAHLLRQADAHAATVAALTEDASAVQAARQALEVQVGTVLPHCKLCACSQCQNVHVHCRRWQYRPNLSDAQVFRLKGRLAEELCAASVSATAAPGISQQQLAKAHIETAELQAQLESATADLARATAEHGQQLQQQADAHASTVIALTADIGAARDACLGLQAQVSTVLC